MCSFFAFAAEQDCTNVAVNAEIQTIKPKREDGKIVKFLSENALKVLLEQPNIKTKVGLRNMMFMVLMYDTGVRCNELLNIKVGDLRLYDESHVAYLHGKRGKTRIVPLMSKTVEHCKRYIKEFHNNDFSKSSDYLFYTVIHERKHQMSADTVATFMKQYGESARENCLDIPERVHPHMLRHTRAMHYYHEGMPMVILSEYLGHADPKTTKVYAYADTKMKRKAMENAEPMPKNTPDVIPIWEGNDDMILKLAGLK